MKYCCTVHKFDPLPTNTLFFFPQKLTPFKRSLSTKKKNTSVVILFLSYTNKTTEKNEPASKYWSFSLAVDHGFIDTEYPHDACIHPPATDWAKPLQSDSGADLAAAPVEGAPSSGDKTSVVEEATTTGVDLAVRFFFLFSAAFFFFFYIPCGYISYGMHTAVREAKRQFLA